MQRDRLHTTEVQIGRPHDSAVQIGHYEKKYPQIFAPNKDSDPLICRFLVQISHSFSRKVLIFILFLHKNLLWYSLEVPHRGTSNEYPQHMFSWRNMKIIMQIPAYLVFAGCPMDIQGSRVSIDVK